MADLPMGEFRWLTVTSPEGLDGIELVLEPMGLGLIKNRFSMRGSRSQRFIRVTYIRNTNDLVSVVSNSEVSPKI